MCTSSTFARLAPLVAKKRLGCALLALLPASHVNAGEILPDDVQIHGFASQSFIKTDHNSFFGDSENGSFEYYELGVNGSWAPRPDLQFSLQVVARDAGAGDNGSARVDYGFMDYSFISNATELWGLRLGRIINPYGFYNDTRDVAFTRPSILLPQSIYFDSARSLSLSSDGVQLYGEHRSDEGDLLLQLGYARPRTGDINFKYDVFRRDVPGKLDGALPSFFARALYETFDSRWRFGVTAARVNTDYTARYPYPTFFPDEELADLSDGRFLFTPIILSAQYNSERWTFTSEYAWRKAEFFDFQDIPDQSFIGESYYLQGTYRITPKWEAFLRYDVLYWDKDDRGGTHWERDLRRGPYHSAFAKDWSAGVRWDVTENFMLRAEFHNVDGTGWLPVADNPAIIDPEQWDSISRRWNLFAMLASFRF